MHIVHNTVNTFMVLNYTLKYNHKVYNNIMQDIDERQYLSKHTNNNNIICTLCMHACGYKMSYTTLKL